MIENLIYFINRPNKNTRDALFRKKTGYFVSITGIVFNIILSVAKVLIGLFVHSIAIMADAVNNIFDTISSVVTLLGFKLSEKPADKDHPYGHGRIEYISGLLISIIVIIIGLQFIKSSVLRILNPDIVKFDHLSFFIMILSILVKVFITILNKKAGDMIAPFFLLRPLSRPCVQNTHFQDLLCAKPFLWITQIDCPALN